MQEQINEQIEVETQTVATEEVKKGEDKTDVSLGKFKDVSALLGAYNSLQSEFTKRCQKIKELEGKLAENDKANDSQREEKAEKTEMEIGEEKRQEIVKEYLSKILSAKSNAVVISEDGKSAKAPLNKPKSITEAGAMAKQIFK